MAKYKAILDLPHTCYTHASKPKKTQTKCRKAMIDKYGMKGAYLPAVLNDFCLKHGLHCQEIQGNENIISVLNERRPVLADFGLTGPEWYNFHKFYNDHPTEILEKKHLFEKNKSDSKKGGRHSVILMRVEIEPKCLVFMNSWGESFADFGFFRVKDINVLNLLCFDVYSRLEPSEIQKYNDFCKENTKNMIHQNMPSAFYKLNYQCPTCHQYSPIESYAGDIFMAQCPKCSNIVYPNLNDLFDSLADYQLNINNS